MQQLPILIPFLVTHNLFPSVKALLCLSGWICIQRYRVAAEVSADRHTHIHACARTHANTHTLLLSFSHGQELFSQNGMRPSFSKTNLSFSALGCPLHNYSHHKHTRACSLLNLHTRNPAWWWIKLPTHLMRYLLIRRTSGEKVGKVSRGWQKHEPEQLCFLQK